MGGAVGLSIAFAVCRAWPFHNGGSAGRDAAVPGSVRCGKINNRVFKAGAVC